MNELNGPFVIIVLNIKEGRGFDFLQNPLYIEASLKGSKIQSDAALPDSNPNICTELVWETEKREVRKLRSSHVPLRVECFTVDADQQKEKIGFILLSLRSAQAVAGNRHSPKEHKWHKLVGMPSDYRVSHPELSLTLTIRDRSYQGQAVQPNVNMCIEQIICDKETLGDSNKPIVMPIKYLENGLIQIGEDSPDLERFLLSLHVGTACNLDLLLPASKVFHQSKEKYFISLSILGLTINTKSFCKNLHDPINLNDRIIFKLQATLQILKLFFDQYQNIPVNFCHGKEKLASTEIDLKNFFNLDQLGNYIACNREQNYIFHIAETGNIPLGVDERKPCVGIETILNYYQNNNSADKDVSVSNSVDSFSNSLDSVEDTQNASGDQKRNQEKQNLSAVKLILPKEDAAVQTTPRDKSIVAFTATKSMSRSMTPQLQLSSNFDDLGNFHLYSLTIVFRSITWRKSLDIDGFQFQFHHPRTNNSVEIQCKWPNDSFSQIITLCDARCQLNYVSTDENIKILISTYPLIVSICNLQGVPIFDELQLYTKLFLSHNDNVCNYYAVLNTIDDKDDLVCDLQINMEIADLGTNFIKDEIEREFELDPFILDDWISMKTIKDLENWKENQEKIFLDKLKQLENDRLRCLQVDWTKKRINLEKKLHEGLEKCKVLHQELSLVANEMKQRNALLAKQPQKIEDREAIEIRVTQMLEEEMNRTVEQIVKEKQEMSERLLWLSKEKDALQKTIQEKLVEMEELRKTTLTKEQTAGLLQELRCLEEKYQQALTAKTFFKEQWRKALAEVHALKCEDQRKIQLEIRKKKEELSQFNINSDEDSFYTLESDNIYTSIYNRNGDNRRAFLF